MERTKWERWASVAICAVALVLGVYIAAKYLFGIFLPFIIAFLVATIITPGASWLEKNTGFPRKLCSIVLLVAILAIIVIPSISMIKLLIEEIRGLISAISSDKEGIANILADLFGALDRFSERFPLIDQLEEREEMSELGDKLDKIISDALGRLLGELSAFLPSAAIDIIGKLPRVVLVVGITLIATVYFCIDTPSVTQSIKSLLPERVVKSIPSLKLKTISMLWKWARAYLILFFLTFIQLYIGFLILGVDYALLLSLTVSVVDIFPVIGIGTILIPWGLFSFIIRDVRMGVGLLIIYAVITVVRQISEPKILGKSLGIHPVLTLVAMYGGLRLCGVLGMLLFPMIPVAVKGFLSE